MTGDQRAECDRLVLRGLRLAYRVANDYASKTATRAAMADDIRSAALEGLVEAASDFRPGRGAVFTTYARHRIKGAVLDFLRAEDHVSRHFRMKSKAGKFDPPSAPVSLDCLLEDAGDRFADPRAVDPSEAAEIAEAASNLARLPDRLRAVLTMHYGQGLTLVRVGAALGFTESRAFQLLHEARREFMMVAGDR